MWPYIKISGIRPDEPLQDILLREMSTLARFARWLHKQLCQHAPGTGCCKNTTKNPHSTTSSLHCEKKKKSQQKTPHQKSTTHTPQRNTTTHPQRNPPQSQKSTSSWNQNITGISGLLLRNGSHTNRVKNKSGC